MTTTGPTELETELTAVRGELVRLDTKCGTLTTVAGAVMALLTSQIGRSPLPVRLVLALAGVALAASAVVLLAGVLRPRLGKGGFVRYATMTTEEITRTVSRCEPARRTTDDLRFLSVLVVAKQRRLRLAVDLLITGLVLIGIALAMAVIA